MDPVLYGSKKTGFAMDFSQNYMDFLPNLYGCKILFILLEFIQQLDFHMHLFHSFFFPFDFYAMRHNFFHFSPELQSLIFFHLEPGLQLIMRYFAIIFALTDVLNSS